MGFTLLRGRGFTEDENLRERYVTVVNQELAKRYSLGLDPIGKRVRPTDSPPGPWLTVVGMVSDERHPLSGEPMPAEGEAVHLAWASSPPHAARGEVSAQRTEQLC